MASATLTLDQFLFPNGTTVYATPQDFNDEPVVAVVASNAVSFDGLHEDTAYLARARVAGSLNEVRFRSSLDTDAALSGTVEMVAGAGGVVVSDDAALQALVNAHAYRKVIDVIGALSITTTVRLVSGTHLRFAPGAKLVPTAACTGSVLKNAGNGSTEGTSTGDDDITIEHLEIDGQKALRASATGHLIDFRGGTADPCTNIRILHAHGYDSPKLGFVFQNCQNVVVDSPHIHGNERDGCSFFWNCQRIKVITPDIHDCKDDLLAFNCEDLTTTGHTMSDIQVVSPHLYNGTTQGSGLAIRGVKRIKVSDPIIDSTMAATVFIANFNTSGCDDVRITNPTIINAGSANTGGAGPAIEINAGSVPFSGAGYADVTNVAITGMDVRNPRSHGVVLSGTANAKLQGITLSGRIVCSNLYASGRGVAATGGYVEDLTADLDITGAQLGAARVTGTGIKRVKWSGRAYDNANGTSTAGVAFDGVEDLRVDGLRAYDTRATKLQTYGLSVANPTGELVVTNNDCVGNLTGTIQITQGASATTQVIRNNASYDPRSGSITTSSTLSNVVAGGATIYYRDVALVFTVPFPTAVTAKVTANAKNVAGASVAVYVPTNVGCTIRVQAARSDLPATDVDWMATA